MNRITIRNTLFLTIAIAFLYSFKGHPSWLELCSGLAFFLFGMQCMNDGLQQLAGGRLERILAKSTETPFKGLLFGMGSTMILQSTTVVSLLTIAFISTGLITLAAGITIIIGANLGASSGIWLLALAGQNISLGPFAYPMIVLGVLASFNGKKSKALGRVLLGIAFILLAIDLIKNGFSSFTDGLDFTELTSDGLLGTLIFVGAGLLITVILQSSHATLMLVLTALGLGQIDIEQSFALAIGSIIGSAVATGVVGFLGGDRSGRRLALAHVIFNVVTGTLSIILLSPLTLIVTSIGERLGLNPLIQLALFHTLFNIIGVTLFWFLQYRLAALLMRWIPDVDEPPLLIEADVEKSSQDPELKQEPLTARYLTDASLSSVETAISALYQELRYLGRMSLEVICHALYLPTSQLSSEQMDYDLLKTKPESDAHKVNDLYQYYIKGIYSDLLTFIGRIDYPDEREEQQQILVSCQLIALELVGAVKNSQHLQLNMAHYLTNEDSPARDFYIQIRKHILLHLREIYQLGLKESEEPGKLPVTLINSLLIEVDTFDQNFRSRLFISVRKNQIDGFSTSSLMNDLTYSNHIIKSLYNILKLAVTYSDKEQKKSTHQQEESHVDDLADLGKDA